MAVLWLLTPLHRGTLTAAQQRGGLNTLEDSDTAQDKSWWGWNNLHDYFRTSGFPSELEAKWYVGRLRFWRGQICCWLPCAPKLFTFLTSLLHPELRGLHRWMQRGMAHLAGASRASGPEICLNDQLDPWIFQIKPPGEQKVLQGRESLWCVLTSS